MTRTPDHTYDDVVDFTDSGPSLPQVSPSNASAETAGVPRASADGGLPEPFYKYEDDTRPTTTTDEDVQAEDLDDMPCIRRTGTLIGHNIPYTRAFPNRPPKERRLPFWRHYARPGWFFDHLNIASLKIVLRSWIGVWIGFLLMMIPAFNDWCGSAPYLLPVVAVIVPAGSMPITVCFLLNAIMMLFTAMGYAVMVVAMRINNTYFHNSINSEGMARQLIQSGLCTAPTEDPATRAALTQCVIDQIYDGKFMTARGSVVYAVILGAFMFFMLWMKNKSRILIPGYLCGVIAVGALLPIAHMFPYFQPNTIGLVLLKPMGLQCAINCALSILVFPFSSGFQFTQTALEELKILEGLAKFQALFLTSTLPSNEQDWLKFSQTEAGIQKARQVYPKLESEVALLHIELTYSRFTVPDYIALKNAVGRVISGMSGLVYFYDNVESIRRAILLFNDGSRPIDMTRRMSAATGNDRSKVDAMLRKRKDAKLGRFATAAAVPAPAPVGIYEMKSGLKGKAHNSDDLTMDDLDTLMVQLREMSLTFMEEVGKSLNVMVRWLTAANTYRMNSIFFFWERKGHRQKQESLAAELAERRVAFQQASDEFLNSKRFELFQDQNEKTHFVTFFFQGALYCTYMKGVSETMNFLFETLENMDKTEAEPSWSIGKGVQTKLPGESGDDEDDSSDDTWHLEKEFKNYSRPDEEHLTNNKDLDELFAQSIHATDRKRNPDAKAPTTKIGIMGGKVRNVIMKLLSPDVIVPLKGAVFTVLCAMPFFFKSTAPWFRRERMVWSVIMTGLSISENMADNLYGFGSRILYTFYAGVVAMVAWYISTGNGDGNRAGFMVVVCILYFILMFYREFAVHTTPMPTIVMVVTTVIILGLSWTDGMKITLPTIGVGYEVAWKRFVTVVIGLSFGFICALVPRPVTGKRIIRTTLASIIKDTGSLYCRVSDFAVGRLVDPSRSVDLLKDPIFGSIVNAQGRIAGSRFLASMVQYEPSLQGQWPSKVYREVTTIVSEMVELHHHLYIILRRLEDPRYWLPHLLDLVGWSDQPLMSHYFAVLYMAQGALYDGSPLPQVTPAKLMVEHLDLLENLFKTSFDADARAAMGDSVDDMEIHDADVGDRISLERLKTQDGMVFSAAIVLSNCIFDRMDRLMFQVKTLVGEQFVNSEYYRNKARFNEKFV